MDGVQAIYETAAEFERLAERMAACSGLLKFKWEDQPDGTSKIRLREAQFCRVRHCPVCQWRKSLMMKARFHALLPELEAGYPKARWIYAVITQRNCAIADLRETIQAMNASWKRFINRQEFRMVQGWIRTTEVTRGKDGSAHPHFNVLMMVPESYFQGKYYLNKSRWVDLWKDAARLDYEPSLYVSTVKPNKKQLAENAENPHYALLSAVKETLKYSVKPGDMLKDESWFLELTRQVHRLRFFASGGALKDMLKEDDETADLIHVDEEGAVQQGEDDGERIAFTWRPSSQKYRRCKGQDVD